MPYSGVTIDYTGSFYTKAGTTITANTNYAPGIIFITYTGPQPVCVSAAQLEFTEKWLMAEVHSFFFDQPTDLDEEEIEMRLP
jgi:hypothetical protein